MKLWPFTVVEGAENTPLIEVEYKGEKKLFKSEEISSMALSKVRSIAEDDLGKEIRNIVITVPANSPRIPERSCYTFMYYKLPSHLIYDLYLVVC